MQETAMPLQRHSNRDRGREPIIATIGRTRPAIIAESANRARPGIVVPGDIAASRPSRCPTATTPAGRHHRTRPPAATAATPIPAPAAVPSAAAGTATHPTPPSPSSIALTATGNQTRPWHRTLDPILAVLSLTA